jgi:hypothetical protein
MRQLAEEATRDQQTPIAYLAALFEADVTERVGRRRTLAGSARPAS